MIAPRCKNWFLPIQFPPLDRLGFVVLCLGFAVEKASGQTPPAPQVSLTISNAQKKISWDPYPAALEYQILSSTSLGFGFSQDGSGVLGWNSASLTWTSTNSSAQGFYNFQVTPMTSDALLT